MTGQALFYMGQKNLKHKILAVSEEEGARRAAYPLKLLQSEGVLKIASTGKDPVSGKLVTHEYVVEGPVMIFLTTTAQEVDEELLNRAIVLTVNEDREQTRAIHRRQREARTIEGTVGTAEAAKLVRLHRNAQRLLRPIARSQQPLTWARLPRPHDADAARSQETVDPDRSHCSVAPAPAGDQDDACDGETLEYIEATQEDVKLAQQLVRPGGLIRLARRAADRRPASCSC